MLLAARERPITGQAVAELLGISKQATSQLLDAMEGEGHLTRHRAPKDARAKHVEITTVGLHLLTAVEAIYAELEAEWGLHIGVNQLEGVRTALTDVLLAEFDGSLPPIRPTW